MFDTLKAELKAMDYSFLEGMEAIYANKGVPLSNEAYAEYKEFMRRAHSGEWPFADLK